MAAPSDDEIRRRYGLPPGTRIVRLTPDELGRVRVEPDAFAYVTVRSALEWGTWDRPAVVAGGVVRLSVQGTMVGEGAPVEVTLKDARDRTVGRGRGRMHRDRVVVPVEVDRRAADRDPDGVLCAADVEVRDLGLTVVSAALLVLPFAELRDARWGAPEARDGDVVGLSCRLSGSPAGVERAGRGTAEVEVLRGDEGGGDGLAAVFEPVASLRAPVVDGRLSVQWRVGYGADGKARIATQPELDEAAGRTGAAPERYRRPAWRFRVRLAGLEAESPDMAYRDHVDLAWDADTERPAAGAPVEVSLADGTTQEETLGDDGRLRLADVPPGPVEAVFGPDPRPWEPTGAWTETGADERPALAPLPLPPDPAVRPAPPVLLASAGSDAAVLADLLRAQDEDEGGFVEWLWGTLQGDFNEDPTYGQIVATMAVTWIPVVDQIADLRDIAAAIYLLVRDDGAGDRDGGEKRWVWFGLVATLVGLFPVFGSLLKGVLRIVAKGIRTAGSGGLDVAADVLRRVFERVGQGDPAAWARALDRDRILAHARDLFRWASDYVVAVFRWAQDQAGTAIVRAHERVVGGAAEVAYGVADGFRRLLGRTPPERAVVATRSLAERLGAVAASVERVQREANERIGAVLGELLDGLDDLLERAGRGRPGGGVTGDVVTPGRVPDDDLFPEGGAWRPRRPGEYDYDLDNPGPLTGKRGSPDRNFRGLKYNVRVLEEDRVYYRAGRAGGGDHSFGRWFTEEPPTSAASVRVDSAVRDVWTNNRTGAFMGQSPIEWVYPVRVPKGTTIYEGPTGSQGGVHLGGDDRIQIYIEDPRASGVMPMSGYPIPRP